jgi:hypothetical protein
MHMQALHDCGMTKLSLEANQLSGEMDDAWGNMVRLKVLNLGKWTTMLALAALVSAKQRQQQQH